jgi:anti-anti-sigma factor
VDAGQPFQIECRRRYVCLSLSGDINTFAWDAIERSGSEILKQVESSKTSSLIVDLSGMSYLGSAQVALLVRVWKVVQARKGRMVVEVTTPVVREVLHTAGLNRLWEFVDSRAAAYAALNLQPDGRPQLSWGWLGLGMAALGVAIGAWLAPRFKSEGLDPKMLLAVGLGAAGLALVTGLLVIIKSSGVRRGLGIAMVVGSALVAVVEVWNR